MDRILLSPPDVGADERNALLEAFDSNWIAPVGPHLQEFETSFAEFTGSEAAAAVSSGTAALHLALLLAGVGAGDVVMVPTLTFVATANAVTYVSAVPHFVDVSKDSWTLDPDLLRDAIRSARRSGSNVGAVIAVDIYGTPCDYEALSAVCQEFEIPLLADAAESLGSTHCGQSVAAAAPLAAFSFNGNKIMTTSGGGMLTGTSEMMTRARYLASQARQAVPHYEHTEVGFNYRMSNLLAALGTAQLRNLPARIDRRRELRARYAAALGEEPRVSGLLPTVPYGESNCWLTVIRLAEASPDRVCQEMDARGIEARRAWKPMHRQPLFSTSPSHLNGASDEVYAEGVCLPSGSSLTDEEQHRVIHALGETLDSI